VFVGNLSYDTTRSELENLFSEVGQVVEIFLPTDRSTGRPRGFAFVELANQAGVIEAIEKLNGQEFNGRSLRVSQAEDRPQQSLIAVDKGPVFGHGADRTPKPKGSRRNIRAKKRSLWK
jgi:RNA recognition motif-containing protein